MIRGKVFLKILKNAQFGTVDLLLPNGKTELYGHGDPLIRVEVKEWSALDLIFSKGDIGLAEAIIDESIVVDDVTALVRWACENDQSLAQALHGTWKGTFLAKLRHFLNRNDRSGSQKNISAHYDLGNGFYNLWLDSTMTYSAAIYSKGATQLAEAQKAKFDRIVEVLDIKPGDHVLEIGCGWGGFFSHAVEKTGCKVTAVMNSAEQARHNEKLIDQKGMKSHVNLVKQDYRDIQGKFDKVVSIEMIEAVGEKYWKDYFEKINSSLTSHGKALIQGITIREDLFSSYKNRTDFIQQYIFPGGMLPTKNTFSEHPQKQGMKLVDVFEFGHDYAQTLNQWRQNFNRVIPQLKLMGFDDKFIRLWNLYLSYCEGAFLAKRIDVGQFALAK
ncbi:MAG: cyclopropane-fatty-acyl-phospholipid synthase family protein [Bdellovibrionales bacterium]|nr:cyclopropane-fatty-acyl-phospholipid synthase family protein [Bdellovibrionales bacterium]